jgi:hypothetical protein
LDRSARHGGAGRGQQEQTFGEKGRVDDVLDAKEMVSLCEREDATEDNGTYESLEILPE